MDKKIKVLLIVVILGVAGVVLYDSLSTRIDKRPDNPWQYEVEEFKSVDEKLLSHREVRRIEIDEPVALAWQNGKLFLLAGNSLQIITPEGRELFSKRLDQNPRRMKISLSLMKITWLCMTVQGMNLSAHPSLMMKVLSHQ
jgi:hypothetical protein